MNFLGTTFGLLTFERGRIFCGSMYYFVFIITVGLYFLMKALGVVKMAQKLEAQDKKIAEDKQKKTEWRGEVIRKVQFI